uniref:Uncharacterized protein n=1 Tax=Rhabditophanes sp. KR3021 TaxID=114890 RepID=A0AC35TW81_9BILA
MSDVDYSAIPSTSKYVPPLYSRYTSDSLSISSKHNGCEDGSESSSISSLASCHESFQVDVKQNDDQTHLLLAAKKSFTSYGTSPGSLEKDLKPSPLIEAKKISTVPKLAPTNKFGPKAQQKMVLTSRMPDRPSLPYGHRPTKSLILTAIQTLIIIFLILFILKSYLFKIFTANSDTDIQKKLEQDEAEVREFFRNNGGNVEEHSFKKKFFSKYLFIISPQNFQTNLKEYFR